MLEIYVRNGVGNGATTQMVHDVFLATDMVHEDVLSENG